jgi:Ser/Thr protein kinase RdoA (MazF antagonist)
MKNYQNILRYAWRAYDHTRAIATIDDISAKVSTNHVYKLVMADGNVLIAKVTFFGSYEAFAEDHVIIDVLANNLPVRYAGLLSRALMKGNQIFFHRYIDEEQDAWIVFYRPLTVVENPPRRLTDEQVVRLGREIATFHADCTLVSNTLPKSDRDMTTDVNALLRTAATEYPDHHELIAEHGRRFLENTFRINVHGFTKIPVFVDWNIGNFSLDGEGHLASRWDYDWFRLSTRVTDFYFLSRVVSEVGDRTSFTYEVDRLMEPRFLAFLQAYHGVFPLSRTEVLFIKESYRFFLLNYVLRLGRFFFRRDIADKLARDVLETHLPTLDDRYSSEPILAALDL